MLYGPCLLNRERVITSERLNGMVSVVKAIEAMRSQFGIDGFAKVINKAFGKFYKKPVLKSKVANCCTLKLLVL